MDSGCPDCWGYNDTHPCLCHGRADQNALTDTSASVPALIDQRDPPGTGPGPSE
jgi:hypothetical protein